jgi:hypothetical protein
MAFFASQATPAMGTIIQRGNNDGLPWVAAKTTLGTGDSQVYLEAVKPGANGNSLSAIIAVDGNDTPLSVSVSENVLTVNSATDESGNATSTAREVINAINQDDAASILFYADEGDGLATGIVSAISETSLADGQNSTETFSDVGEITGFNGPDEQADEAEVTHLSSPRSRKEFIPTLLDSGNLELDTNLTPQGQGAKNVRRDWELRRTRNFRVRYTDVNRTLYEFTGRVMLLSRSGSLNDALKGTARIRASGGFIEVG